MIRLRACERVTPVRSATASSRRIHPSCRAHWRRRSAPVSSCNSASHCASQRLAFLEQLDRAVELDIPGLEFAHDRFDARELSFKASRFFSGSSRTASTRASSVPRPRRAVMASPGAHVGRGTHETALFEDQRVPALERRKRIERRQASRRVRRGDSTYAQRTAATPPASRARSDRERFRALGKPCSRTLRAKRRSARASARSAFPKRARNRAVELRLHERNALTAATDNASRSLGAAHDSRSGFARA